MAGTPEEVKKAFSVVEMVLTQANSQLKVQYEPNRLAYLSAQDVRDIMEAQPTLGAKLKAACNTTSILWKYIDQQAVVAANHGYDCYIDGLDRTSKSKTGKHIFPDDRINRWITEACIHAGMQVNSQRAHHVMEFLSQNDLHPRPMIASGRS